MDPGFIVLFSEELMLYIIEGNVFLKERKEFPVPGFADITDSLFQGIVGISLILLLYLLL